MVVLEVGIDAQGAIRGSQQVTGAFSRLADSASFVLSSVSGANTALAGFGAALARAQPWMAALAAAFSGVNALMSTFSQRTTQATGEWARLTEQVSKAQTAIKAAALLGLPTAEHISKIGQAQIGGLENIIATGQGTRFGTLQSQTGMSGHQLLTLLRAEGATGISDYMRTGQFVSGQSQYFGPGGTSGTVPTYSSDISQYNVSFADVQKILQRTHTYYQRQAHQQNIREGGAVNAYSGPVRPGMEGGMNSAVGGFSMAAEFPGSGFTSGNMVSMSPDRQRQIDFDIAQQRMADIEAMSRRIGDNLGDAAFDFVAGLRDGRDVMASILIDIGRSLSREAIGSLTKNIISTFG